MQHANGSADHLVGCIASQSTPGWIGQQDFARIDGLHDEARLCQLWLREGLEQRVRLLAAAALGHIRCQTSQSRPAKLEAAI